MEKTKIIFVLTIIAVGVLIYNASLPQTKNIKTEAAGIILPVRWGGLGAKMISVGVIDAKKFESLYAKQARLPDGQGGLTPEEKQILYGNAMDHYSRHRLIMLSEEQQKLVERVSKNVYRPCCKNPAYFPDCNHGMAMLGLLELMASQGVSEEEMYKAAEKVNSYWFPQSSAASGCATEASPSQPSCGVE